MRDRNHTCMLHSYALRPNRTNIPISLNDTASLEPQMHDLEYNKPYPL